MSTLPTSSCRHPALNQEPRRWHSSCTNHSAIRGRLPEQVVDHRGDGKGIDYVNQEPYVFYLMVESEHVNWTLSVDEAVAGTVIGSGKVSDATARER